MTDLRKVMDSVQRLSARFDAVCARRADGPPEWFVAAQAKRAARTKAAQTQLNAAEALLPRIAAAQKIVKKHGSSFVGMQNAKDIAKHAIGFYGLAIHHGNHEDQQKLDRWCAEGAKYLIEAERATKRYEDFAAEVARR